MLPNKSTPLSTDKTTEVPRLLKRCIHLLRCTS